MDADKQNQIHQQLVQQDKVSSNLAYLCKQDKMGVFSPKTHTTVYDEETNTHWEVGEGQTVEDIRSLIKSFKSNE
tara:strand:+ start:28 stop:252 length:225 start_codon:yes stop_codon:yes gene_type:complete